MHGEMARKRGSKTQREKALTQGQPELCRPRKDGSRQAREYKEHQRVASTQGRSGERTDFLAFGKSDVSLVRSSSRHSFSDGVVARLDKKGLRCGTSTHARAQASEADCRDCAQLQVSARKDVRGVQGLGALGRVVAAGMEDSKEVAKGARARYGGAGEWTKVTECERAGFSDLHALGKHSFPL